MEGPKLRMCCPCALRQEYLNLFLKESERIKGEHVRLYFLSHPMRSGSPRTVHMIAVTFPDGVSGAL